MQHTTDQPSNLGASSQSEMEQLVRRMLNQGTKFDEESVQALSELTGTPTELIRSTIAEQQVPGDKKVISVVRKGLTTIDPDLRRLVTSLWLALVIGLCQAMGTTIGDRSSFFELLVVMGIMGVAYNALSAPDAKKAAINAGLATVGYFFFYTLVIAVLQFVFRGLRGPGIEMIMIMTCVMSASAFVLHGPIRRFLVKIGVRKQSEERIELLQQLVTIQDKLRATKERMSVLSVDVVGSVKLKQGVDPLAIEFTFNEFHRYVEQVALRRGGMLHSTAGDGVTCMFPDPQEAFQAARTLQSGLFEFNSMRNRLGKPVEVRIGLDFGEVMSKGDHSAQVEFSDVIDTAAHLQKSADPGSVVVSGRMTDSLGPDRVLLVPSESVEGAFTWRPRAKIDPLTLLKAAPGTPGAQPPGVS